MSLDLAQIRIEVERRAAAIDAPDSLLPTYGQSEDSARPHLEVDQWGYHYVIVERGGERERITMPHLDEFLYVVFQSVTFSLACRFEARHRIAGEDSRRQMFQRQVELLGTLDPQWARRCLQEHDVILQRSPLTD